MERLKLSVHHFNDDYTIIITKKELNNNNKNRIAIQASETLHNRDVQKQITDSNIFGAQMSPVYQHAPDWPIFLLARSKMSILKIWDAPFQKLRIYHSEDDSFLVVLTANPHVLASMGYVRGSLYTVFTPP